MRSKVAQRILAETPEETKIFARLYADIVVRINQLLKENNLSQKDLADKMEKRPSEINKWLTGEHNLTLRSLAKLQAELGEPIINVPHRKAIDAGLEVKGYVTIYRNTHVNTTDVEYTNVWKKAKTNNKTPLANVS
ncbi:helix-turn-helix domain-containing protein [Flavobacterium suncheonense]|uniref:helix-turn-helix domain-containing protein n=1 Tax=Flavobacterium suncheonense TaxID=350894 RepID=UPI003FA36A89